MANHHKGPLIYLISFPGGKYYVGQTTGTFENRMGNHKSASNNTKKRGCRLLNHAIRKYGWDNIKREILVYCDIDQLDYYEQKFIESYNSLSPDGYNLISGGNSNKKASVSTKLLQADKARKRDVTVYRKSEEAKSLPKFMHKVDTQYMKGYRITKHPNCSCIHFCDSNKTWEENLQDATEFLEKLNNGEVEVIHEPRQLPIGMQVAGDGYRVFWKDSSNKRHIKHFNTGYASNEDYYLLATSHLMMLKLNDLLPLFKEIRNDLHMIYDKIKKISDSFDNDDKIINMLSDQIDKLRTMFND